MGERCRISRGGGVPGAGKTTLEIPADEERSSGERDSHLAADCPRTCTITGPAGTCRRSRTGQIFLRSSIVWVLSAVAVFWYGTGHAAGPSSGGSKALLAKYSAISLKLQKNQFAAPIYLESYETEGSLRVDMYGIFYYPFDTIRDALQSPVAWCDITFLHTNIKACTTSRVADQRFLTIYSGRKYYQPPSDAYPLKLKFGIAGLRTDYLQIDLAADEGPLLTRDHRIRLEAAPLDRSRTFVHFSYAYRHGPLANLAIRTYFATLARDKVGFSMVPGKNGAPLLIGGVRGALERNTVRYYLALKSYMDTLKSPEGERFEQRIGYWYVLTARYPRQLKEVEEPEYLSNKRREQRNQLMLQKKQRW